LARIHFDTDACDVYAHVPPNKKGPPQRALEKKKARRSELSIMSGDALLYL
jgi:hypothetical protein